MSTLSAGEDTPVRPVDAASGGLKRRPRIRIGSLFQVSFAW